MATNCHLKGKNKCPKEFHIQSRQNYSYYNLLQNFERHLLVFLVVWGFYFFFPFFFFSFKELESMLSLLVRPKITELQCGIKNYAPSIIFNLILEIWIPFQSQLSHHRNLYYIYSLLVFYWFINTAFYNRG